METKPTEQCESATEGAHRPQAAMRGCSVSVRYPHRDRRVHCGDLGAAARRLHRATDARSVLEATLRCALEMTGASAGQVGLATDNELLITLSLHGNRVREERQFVEGSPTPLGMLLEKREIVSGHGEEAGVIAVPLLTETSRLLGAFELELEAGLRFNCEDKVLLEGLACIAALALQKVLAGADCPDAARAGAAATSLLSATIESTVDGIMAVDGHGEIVACNRRFAEMWDIEDEALSSGDSNRLLVSLLGQVRDPVRFFEKVSELYWQPELESYDLVELADGRCFERFSKPKYSGGKPAGRVWTFHDITELKRLEAQLLHAQKMEAVGTLAGGIAHDFNNIMTAVIGYTELLSAALSPPAPYDGYLANISDASGRAVALVRNLLAYSRKDPMQTEKVECNAMVRNLMGLMERLIGADLVLDLCASPEPLGILADQGQIEQVLVNLVTNARDAMPDGGKVKLEVSRVEMSPEMIQGRESAKAGSYVRISVSDTGSGIDEETRNRIFEPFFTTKEVGKGTGLGLSISYGIVKRHGGFISVASEEGRGTTFSVHLPRIESAAETRLSAAVVRQAAAGNETILLVEDNEPVRTLLSQVLSARGYRVIEAVDGEEGVATFRRHCDEIALVILDVIMPRKNGGDAYEEIREMRSDVKAIFISGYTGDIIDRQCIREGRANFLMKPIIPEKLLNLVREVLDAPRPALLEVA